MSHWQTILVDCYQVQCEQSEECPKEFDTFDEACDFMEYVKEKLPDAEVLLIAVIDA